MQSWDQRRRPLAGGFALCLGLNPAEEAAGLRCLLFAATGPISPRQLQSAENPFRRAPPPSDWVRGKRVTCGGCGPDPGPSGTGRRLRFGSLPLPFLRRPSSPALSHCSMPCGRRADPSRTALPYYLLLEDRRRGPHILLLGALCTLVLPPQWPDMPPRVN